MDGVDATDVKVTLVLERTNNFIGGTLQIEHNRIAQFYGNSNSSLSLLWANGCQARLRVLLKGGGIIGSWEVEEGTKACSWSEGRFWVQAAKGDVEKTSVELEERFHTQIRAKLKAGAAAFTLRSYLEISKAFADALPEKHNHSGISGDLAWGLGEENLAAAFFREAANRAHALGEFDNLRSYHQKLSDLLNDYPDWAIVKLRAASTLSAKQLTSVDDWMKLNNLVVTLHREGSFAKALSFAQNSRDYARDHFGLEHPYYFTSINNLAVLYREIGDYQKAHSFFKLALQLRDRVLGEVHPHTLISQNGLAELYEAMGAYEKALPLYQETLDRSAWILGDSHAISPH